MRKCTLCLRPLAAIVLAMLIASPARAQVVEQPPDLVALNASEFHVVTDVLTGATLLRFSTASWNSGTGPMELVAGAVSPDGTGQDVYQRVYSSDGSYRDILAGTFIYHPEHNHFHFQGYAKYTLTALNNPSASQKFASKTSFCLLDVMAVNLSLPGAPRSAHYTTCNPSVQGISVGWADKYGYTLEGQSFNVSGLPDGDYELSIQIDPNNRMYESVESNNVSCVTIHLSVTQLKATLLGGCGTQLVTIQSIVPNTARQGASVSVTVNGTDFVAGMTLGFENGSGPAPVAKNVAISSDGTTLTATVTVKSGGGKAERLWDVRVGPAVLPKGFKVTP